MPEHRRRAGIDRHAPESGLIFAQRGLALLSPVERHQHDVGLFARRCHVGAHVRLVAEGGAGLVGSGVEVFGQGQRIREQRNPHAGGFHEDRFARIFQVRSGADMRDAHGFQCLDGLGQAFGTEIQRVVVGQRHGRKAGIAQRLPDLVRRRTEHVGLVLLGYAARGERTFEVADHNVGAIEELAHLGERIIVAIGLQYRACRAVQHHVADGDYLERPGGLGLERCCWRHRRLWRRRRWRDRGAADEQRSDREQKEPGQAQRHGVPWSFKKVLATDVRR